MKNQLKNLDPNGASVKSKGSFMPSTKTQVTMTKSELSRFFYNGLKKKKIKTPVDRKSDVSKVVRSERKSVVGGKSRVLKGTR